MESTNLPISKKILRKIFGSPKNINDPYIFHKLSLTALLAWIGLGADGLSSSSYGPEEAFRTLETHTYLAVFLALATAFTVFIISYAYSKIIEHFPSGGGGYIVATHTLGNKFGVISGCALIVDYILTITVSIAACTDALFSYLPLEFHKFKILTASLLIIALIILNIRGVKESITILAPIFITFILTHIFLLGYGLICHLDTLPSIGKDFHSNFTADLSTIGGLGIFLIFVRAYSLGGGTYTGIEAVSNGLQIMREPRVNTGKRTMLYMATSLALTAGGLLICYLLLKVRIVEGKTLNAVLANALFGQWKFGHYFALITILSEGALLWVAAQAGFIDAPRVMANMAIDSWFPRRFSSLSDRLTVRNGIILIGISALILLICTRGSISVLVVMYSINVFLTFSISEFGMARFFIRNRNKEPFWRKNFTIQFVGLLLCLTILIIMITEKFTEGGWITLLITSLLIAFCYIIKRHYHKISKSMRKLDDMLMNVPFSGTVNNNPVNKNDMTAIQLVNGFNGFGVHTTLSLIKEFPGLYKNFIFVSVAVIDQGMFKGEKGIDSLKKSTEESLKKYVDLARKLGFPAEYRMTVGTDVVESVVELCKGISKEFRHSTVFSGQLVFKVTRFYHKLLHNEAAFTIQRQLQWNGITNVILPIRMMA